MPVRLLAMPAVLAGPAPPAAPPAGLRDRRVPACEDEYRFGPRTGALLRELTRDLHAP